MTGSKFINGFAKPVKIRSIHGGFLRVFKTRQIFQQILKMVHTITGFLTSELKSPTIRKLLYIEIWLSRSYPS